MRNESIEEIITEQPSPERPKPATEKKTRPYRMISDSLRLQLLQMVYMFSNKNSRLTMEQQT